MSLDVDPSSTPADIRHEALHDAWIECKLIESEYASCNDPQDDWLGGVAGDCANAIQRLAAEPFSFRSQSTIAAHPKVVCLCGSTKFIETFAIKTWELEQEDYIVLGCTLLPSWYCPVPHHFAEHQGVKEQRDEHHLRKIDLANEVLVLNVGGYIGESTRNEIAYAEKTGKPVRYLEPPDPPADAGVKHD